MKKRMKSIREIAVFGVAISLMASCSAENIEAEIVEADIIEDSSDEIEMPREEIFEHSKFYTSPSEIVMANRVKLETPNALHDGDDSDALKELIKKMPEEGGVIEIPKGIYYLSKIEMKSNVNIEIEANTVIYHSTGLTDNSPSRIFDFGGPGQQKVENASIYGKDGRFIIDLTGFPINMDVAVARIAETYNFRLADFDIKDNRSEFASILIAFVDKVGVDEPWPHNGIIENISQTDAHTGYGLIQGYAADNVLFENLSCEGGVTFRLETDDRAMKSAGKGGMRDVFANKITGIDGLCPVMLSPHFAQNGNVTIEEVTAIGCAYAVRVEHGFLEIFADEMEYPTSSRTHGIRFKNDIEEILGENAVETFYKRNRGKNWAVRITNSFNRQALESNNSLLQDQLEGILPGKFDECFINNVMVTYKDEKTAKIKQPFLRYLPCEEWDKVILPLGLNVPKGFEYHGPSLGVSIDNTTDSGVDGNYTVLLTNVIERDFPSQNLLNVNYDSEILCDNLYSTISE